MTRANSEALKRAVTARETSEAFLVLLDIDDPARTPDATEASMVGGWLSSLTPRTADDASSAGDDMTAVGSPIWLVEGASLGGAADYFRRAEADWRASDTKGTIMAWIKRASATTADVIFSTCDEGSFNDVFRFGLRADDFVELEIKAGGAGLVRFRGDTTITDTSWHHVAAVSTSTSFAMYVDGQSQGLTFTTGTDDGSWISAVSNRDSVAIGVLADQAPSDHFHGSIRDVRYYSRALGSTEVATIYRAGLISPVRVVNDRVPLFRGGNEYAPFPFEIPLPDEREDGLHGVQLRIDAVDRSIITALRQVRGPLEVQLSVVLASQPDIVEAGPYVFALDKANYNAVTITGALEFEDIINEPIPGDAFTPGNFPGVFEGVG
jgi:hypothetical protein